MTQNSIFIKADLQSKIKYFYKTKNILLKKILQSQKQKIQKKQMSDGSFVKIQDSKSWVFSFQHFTQYNSLAESPYKNETEIPQEIQYVTASTFDKWFVIKKIDVKNIKWIKIEDMKMTMPVVNSFIQFDSSFQPQSIVLAYFDGSIDYSPWQKIQQNYCLQIQGGKKRSLKKTFLQVIQKSQRPAYINTIYDDSNSLQEVFMLETNCFLYKKNDFIFALNYKGELKILKVDEKERQIRIVQKIDFQWRILKAQCLIDCQASTIGSIIVAICIQNISTPFIFEISPATTREKLLKDLEILCQKHFANQDNQNKSPTKLMTYDPRNNLIITVTQDNEIMIFSFGQQCFQQKEKLYIAYFEKIFSLTSKKDGSRLIIDVDVKDEKLAIMCKKFFFLYDLKEDFMIQQGQRVKEFLDTCKLVSVTTEREKPLLLVKKKFDYTDPKERKSTTLHLFIGK